MYDINRVSPFHPWSILTSDKFKGRYENVNKILRYVKAANMGDVQHFFLTGERGMGKTSLAEYVKNFVENEFNMTGIYVTNRNRETLNFLLDAIVSGLLQEVNVNIVKDKIQGLFGKIESFEFKGTKVQFKSGLANKDYMISDFPFYINDLINEINPDNGVFLIIDDINGLSESKEFVDFYKAFSEIIEIDNHINMKLYVLFVGYSEKFDNLVLQEPSFGRIFHTTELKGLENDEIKEFFISNFNLVDIECENEALDLLADFSLGLPLMMQQLGDSAFWLTNDDVISKDMVPDILKNAINELGDKPLRQVLNDIENKKFDSFLIKLGRAKLFSFKKEEFIEYLDVFEKEHYEEFIKHMLDIGVFVFTGSKDLEEYSFSNLLYYLYFMIKSYDF